jgi:hypothetical protein
MLRLRKWPLTAQVDLRPNQIVDALFDLPPAPPYLPKVNVVADRGDGIASARIRQASWHSNGFGHYIGPRSCLQSDV